jgi:hypothetical protein
MENLGFYEIIVILFAITIFFIGPVFLAWFFIRRARFKERMLLIDRGIDIKDFNLKRDNPLQFPWLKTGITLVGLSLGYFFVSILQIYLNIGAIHFYAIILLFAGLSMIIANFVGNPKISDK